MLDFFGVLVKADDLLTRVEELQLLAKRVSRYENPISQFQALMYLKPATWSKGCGWNQSKFVSFYLGIRMYLNGEILFVGELIILSLLFRG